MMCGPCKQAGVCNAMEAPRAAEALHQECEAPSTCTCQHVTGHGHLNFQLVRTSNEAA